jgi:hypothetical protein
MSRKAYLPLSVRREVIRRAHRRCEYCLLHADYATFVHEIDHVLPRKHGGGDSADNLAYACAQCNRYKGSDFAAVDPETGEIVSLFNPRTELWAEHFRLDEFVIEAITPTGRATMRLLQLNQIDRLLLRQELYALGRYP